jgi:hypothetical protein
LPIAPGSVFPDTRAMGIAANDGMVSAEVISAVWVFYFLPISGNGIDMRDLFLDLIFPSIA